MSNDMGTSYHTEKPGWQRHAACSSAGLDPQQRDYRTDLFALRHPSELQKFGEPAKHPKVAEALSFCARCPVRQECGDYVKQSPDYPLVGVWGGRYLGWAEAEKNLREAHRSTPRVRTKIRHTQWKADR